VTPANAPSEVACTEVRSAPNFSVNPDTGAEVEVVPVAIFIVLSALTPPRARATPPWTLQDIDFVILFGNVLRDSDHTLVLKLLVASQIEP